MSRVAAAALAALALSVPAGAASTVDPGLTSTSVLLGGTVPLTGEAAAFGTVGRGARAYFDYVNARGGVHGRKIEYRYYDDAYNPAQTVQLTRRLVEQDRVFAVFGSVGTANNLAIRDYLNAQKVPQLFVADGSQQIGRSFARYPWTMGFLMSYRGEGDVYGKTIARTRPRAKLAVLYESTDLGRDLLTGLTRGIARKGPRMVAREAYELTAADVSSQIARLKASGADTLLLFATPKFFIQAVVATRKLAWKPQLYTLRRAGRNLTRAGLLRAAQHLDLPANPFLLPGIRLQTSPQDYRPLEHAYLYRYDNKQWVRASAILRARG